MFFNEVYLRNNVNSNFIFLLYIKKSCYFAKLTKSNISSVVFPKREIFHFKKYFP